MDNISGSRWAEARFGGLAAELSFVCRDAMHTAHGLAFKAHQSAEMDHNDTYGNTLKVKMHEVLLEMVKDIPGVLIKPSGGRFDIAVVEETSVALLPIRYSNDRRITRLNAKIDISDLRRSLLALVSPNHSNPRQSTIDEALDEEFDADTYDEEMCELDKQLGAFGQVATIGFGSNPSGLWGLGWGDLRVNESDKAVWEEWETLPDDSSAREGIDLRPYLSTVTEGDKPAYFDQTDEVDEIEMFPRHHPHTGSIADEDSDDSNSTGEASNS